MRSSSRSLAALHLFATLTFLGCETAASEEADAGETGETADAPVGPTVDARLDPTRDAGDPCVGSPCVGGCVRSDAPRGFDCTCPAPFAGDDCRSLDWCAGMPCQHDGTCTQVDDRTVLCACADGFVGTYCEFPDPCTATPCANGGTCSHAGGGLPACSCPPPFVGDTCEERDPCTAAPCENGGTCTTVDETTFTCGCPAGFRGDRCELTDACLENPCLNGGRCLNTESSFMCECPSGYSGSTCATNVNDCPVPQPCLNGGTCVDGLNTYSCACTASFGGDDCSVACSGASATAVADGSWTSPATWGGVVPGPGTFVVIPVRRTVTIPVGANIRVVACAGVSVTGTLVNRGSLTVDGVFNLRGSEAVPEFATLRNEGTLVTNAISSDIQGCALVNAAGATMTTRNGVRFHTLSNEGTWSIEGGAATCVLSANCTFANAGALTVARGATLELDTSTLASSTGTLVNHGNFRTRREFETRGVFTNTGRVEAVFDGAVRCAFTNHGTGTLTNSGVMESYCVLETYGTLTNTGLVDVRGTFRSYGTFTNEMAGTVRVDSDLTVYSMFVNRGLVSPQPAGSVSIPGTFLNEGTISSVGRVSVIESGTITVAAGSLFETFEPAGNRGTFNHDGRLVVGGARGTFSNNGVFHQYCGSTVVVTRGPTYWFGNPAMIESPCP